MQALLSIRDGDLAILIPPTSKADQFGLEWGPNPIYLRFDSAEAVNAARELRDLELCLPLSGADRRAHALFVDGFAKPLGQEALRSAFKARLAAAGFSDEQVRVVSLHSFRVYLACCLLDLHRSKDEIKALLRWKSDEALLIYARLNPDAYANLLAGVGAASVESMRSHNLPQAAIDPATARAVVIRNNEAALIQAGQRADARDNVDADNFDDEPPEDEDGDD